MCGLHGSGKTTLLYKLLLGEVVTTIPTIGYNFESFEYKDHKFNIWDISEESIAGRMLNIYLEGVDCLIFVVDGNDRDLLE